MSRPGRSHPSGSGSQGYAAASVRRSEERHRREGDDSRGRGREEDAHHVGGHPEQHVQ